MIALIGLILIIIAWAMQFLFMNKNKKIYTSFVAMYIIGVAFLTYDGFTSGVNNLAMANLISLIVSLAVLIKLRYY
ncbi:MAG: hypothetical protein WCK90_01310 [archaeon]